MTLTKAKAIIAELLDDYPTLETALDSAPLQTSVQSKLEKVTEFAKILPQQRRKKVKAAALCINHALEIGSYN